MVEKYSNHVIISNYNHAKLNQPRICNNSFTLLTLLTTNAHGSLFSFWYLERVIYGSVLKRTKRNDDGVGSVFKFCNPTKSIERMACFL